MTIDTDINMQAIMARLKVLEEKVARLEGTPATGASGSMTVSEPVEEYEPIYGSYVTPKTQDGSKVRNSPTTVPKDNIMYTLPFGAYRKVVGSIQDYNDPSHRWYILDDDGYMRMDVATREWHKDTPQPQPIAPINAAIWPSPVTGYTITNTHHNERGHNGIDYACKRDTPILCGPNGGTVMKVFICDLCNPKGDGIKTWGDPDFGYGWGTFVIVGYTPEHLPLSLKRTLPEGAYAFCLYAHMSSTPLNAYSVGKILAPYQEIGKVGATGNVYGENPEHLHIEGRYSKDSKASFFAISENVFDPALLFKVKP